jgi:hypothetical protein
LLPVFKLDTSFPDEKNNAAFCSNIHSLSINILILAQPSSASPDCKKTSVWALALKCMSTVTKLGTLGKMYRYSPEKKALMGKCTGTIQTMGPHILKKGRNPEKYFGTVTKMGATMENVPVQFFIKYENIGYHNCLFFFFFFFLLSLFAPLNGIQHIDDISDTHCQFFLPAFCAVQAQFLCDTALPTWQFCLGTLALTTGSLRLKIGRNKFQPLQFIPS